MKDYLFYVRYGLSGLRVYRCKTDDPFHVMGEIMYRCPERIERLSFVKQTDERLKFWKENDIEVWEWKNKYDKENNNG